MEPLHLSADGRVLQPRAVRLALLHPDAAHRPVGRTPEHDQDLLPQGELPQASSAHGRVCGPCCFLQIILGLVLPPAILLLEFKSQAEMCHVPQSQEAPLFGLDPARPETSPGPAERAEPGVRRRPRPTSLACRLASSVTVRLDTQGAGDAERGPAPLQDGPGSVSNMSWTAWTCWFWIKKLYEFYTAPVVKFWFHTVGGRSASTHTHTHTH